MNQTTTAPNHDADTENAQIAPLATLEHLDPNTVVIEANIRNQHVILDEEFLESVRANGIMTPVSGRRGDDGTVHVRYGQRRVLAAREVGLPTIPVYLNATDGTEADRIVGQLVENERRAEMTDVERVDAYRMLELEGLTVAKIAKATGTRKDVVHASVTIAASDIARGALLEDAVSLDMAIALVEFDDDPDACAELMRYSDDDLPWVIQRLRNARIYDAAWERAAEELRTAGLTVMERNDHDYTSLYGLTDAAADADERPSIDAEQHTGCPGHRVLIRVAVTGGEAAVAQTAVCVRPDQHHRLHGGRTGKVDISSLPDEEQEAAREQQRAERRRLIQFNKDWDASVDVRREWLTTLVGRKTLPKDAPVFVATTLAQYSYDAPVGPSEFTGTLVGLTGFEMKKQIAALIADKPGKAGHVSLALALAAREEHTSRDSWRYPRDIDTTYLLQLEAWGYHLSPVERLAAGYPESAANGGDDELPEAA